nr:VCBS domain-containing protein [Ponticoccus alexandrii]
MTATSTATLDLLPVNDAAVISGDVSGTAAEDSATDVTGTLLAADVDNTDNAFQAASDVAAYGSWSIDAAGEWSYSLDDTNPAVNALNEGDTLSDSFTVMAEDGTEQTVSITITGSNDAAVITGDVSGTAAEDSDMAATGTLLSEDVDNADNAFQAASDVAAYGSWSIDAAGAWTYTLDDTNPAVDALNEGDTLSDSFTVMAEDGTEQIVSITITGSNDAAVITGDVSGTAAEDSATDVTGTLLATDVDNADNAFQAASDVAATYGSWSIDAAGAWSYSLDDTNPAVNALNEGDTLSDSFTVMAEDGTEQTVSITITGSNDAAVITGDVSGTAAEDSDMAATGTLLSEDVDNADNAFQAASDVAATYGSWSIDAAGAWTYSLDDTNPAVNALNEGDTLSDSFTVMAEDGTEQTVSITITGSNDAAVITGDVSGTAAEDSDMAATGTLLSEDVDNADNAFQAASDVAATYGSWSIDAAGAWTYSLDDTNPAVNALNEGDTLSDSFTVMAEDGTEQTVSITITGSNDAAVITGDVSGTAAEDSDMAATGTLLSEDVDNADNAFQAASDVATYGSWSIDAAGAWSYSLDDTNPAVNALNEGDTLSDSFTVMAEDGTEQIVSITITGSNDAAVITGDVSGTAAEDSATDVTGTLLATDVDNADNAFQAASDVAATYGSWSIDAAGAWSYSLDDTNPAVNALNEGDTLSDSFTVMAEDGTEQTVSITITGSNDAAVITGDVSGTAAEDSDMAATGTLLSEDVDNADNAFQAASDVAAYGSWSIDAAGAWTYTLDDTNPMVNALNEGDTLSDSFTVMAEDGTEQIVSITITGSNDAAVITGDVSGTAAEDSDMAATGTLLSEDVDNADNAFQAASDVAATYGSWSIDAAGAWTYSLDDTNPAVNALNEGDTLSDSFTVMAEDGTEQTVSITITGSNDAAVITGDVSGTAAEDSDMAATGTLLSEDVDNADNAFQAASDVATYGSWSIDAAGAWSYSLDDTNPAVNALNEGDTLSDSFTVMAEDGTEQTVSITITGSNDAAVITGDVSGTAAEDSDMAATGTLLSEDVDNADNAFQAASDVAAYGSWSIDAAGAWTYTLDDTNPMVNALNEGDTLSDSFTVMAEDGTEQIVSITITGSNDAAVITGDVSGTAAEDSDMAATGTLLSEDVDNADNAFQAASDVAATYGSWSIDAAGAWSYSLDDTNPAVNALNEGDTLSDSFTVMAEDGTEQTVSITITGSNDAAVITGDVSGTAAEDSDMAATGTLLSEDVDNADNAFQAASDVAAYGSWSIDAAGAWTYTLDDTNPAVDALNEGDTLSDSFTVMAEDGTEQIVSITITGSNDAAVITGDVSGTAAEDSATDVTGTLLATDVDNADNAFQAASDVAATYGSWSIDAAGAWSYSLDDTNPAVNALNEGDTLSDSFTVMAEDGTEQTVSITITGSNDAAVITGDVSGTAAEDSDMAATGTLLSEDVDNADNAFQAASDVAATYGSWSIDAAGAWTYSLDDTNPAVNALNEGDTLSDSFTVMAEDGTEQTVSITITGSNDAAVITGDVSGTAAEDSDMAATGTLLSEDVDNADNAFQAASDVAATYGSWSIDAAGAWTYSLDDTNPAVNALNEGDTLSDSFTVMAEDGTEQTVSITITGSNDAAVITGDVSGTAAEDSDMAATGTLLSEDVDNADNAFQAASDVATYGSWSIDAAGAWSYSLDDTNPAVNALNEGDTLSDSFTVMAEDGTEQIVSITITGSNDSPVAEAISGETVDAGAPSLLLTGIFSDPDAGDTLSFSIDTTGTLGSVINNGDGTFSYDVGGALEFLPENETYEDTFTYTVTDALGASSTATATITVTGQDNDDLVNGTENADTLSGGIGDDTLMGLQGNDVLIGGSGADALMGGEGSDTASYTTSAGFVNVSLSTGFAGGGSGSHAIGDTYNSIENLTGSGFNDILNGDGGANVLSGMDGNDTLRGRGGDDVLIGGRGADVLEGGAGSDTADYTTSEGFVNVSLSSGFAGGGAGSHAIGDTYSSIENLTGSGFNDILNGDSGANVLSGMDGNDTLRGRGGDDVLIGGRGADVLEGGAGSDTADYTTSEGFVNVSLSSGFAGGGAGSHAIGDTYSSIENLTGSAFNDILNGDSGANVLSGMDGNDILRGREGADVLNGGEGSDTADYLGSAGFVNVSLLTGYAGGGAGSHAIGDTFNSIENLAGSANNDRLGGDNGDNILTGRGGDDILAGRGGADTFVFGNGFGNDTITDFQDGMDMLDFSTHTTVNAATDLTITTVGSDALVSDGAGNSITLLNAAGLIDDGDFIF